ncbi:MAG: hypothetical protein Kow0056_06390 [Coriobacteriia bacterium]
MTPGARKVVVDSSVAVKWFLGEGEEHVAEARSLLDAHAAGTLELVAPDLLVLEVLNALKHRGVGDAALVAAAEALRLARLEFHPVSELADDAARLAAAHDLTLYDAAFVALALDLDAELVTVDRKLARSLACRACLLGE